MYMGVYLVRRITCVYNFVFFSVLTQELYSSIEKMRPTLFRMASELKPEEEGMTEILQTNETVIRVMDRYKSIFGEPPSTEASSSTTSAATSTTATAAGTTMTSSGGATASGGAEAATGGGASSKQDDVLIDLLDLDLGAPPAGGGNLSSGSGGSIGAGGSGSGTNLGSLLDDLGSLSMWQVEIQCKRFNSLVCALLTLSLSPPLSFSLSHSLSLSFSLTFFLALSSFLLTQSCTTDLPPVASTAQSTVSPYHTHTHTYIVCTLIVP